jgi:hypothetical protein
MFGAFKSYRYRPGRLVRCQSVLRLTMGLRVLQADVYCLRRKRPTILGVDGLWRGLGKVGIS